jgi:hypothetical protein
MKKLAVFLLFSMIPNGIFAQSNDFCNAVSAIIHDGANKFRNIKGKELSKNMNATTWECGIKVPGTINSRFVKSMGLFYEGAFFQTENKANLITQYTRYKGMLDSCFTAQGYTLSQSDNFYQGLQDYKKLIYFPPVETDVQEIAAPSHATMEVAYNKDMGLYTIVLYIFEH